MEQNQPLKKLEKLPLHEPQSTSLKTFTTLQTVKATEKLHFQVVNVTESSHHQKNYVDALQGQIQNSVYQTPQTVHYVYYEAPMTLNAWTQTYSEDFPPLKNASDAAKSDAFLAAKIQELEERLKIQTDEMNELRIINLRSISPDLEVSNSTRVFPSELKSGNEGVTYRILTQPKEASNENEIEIELNKSADCKSPSTFPQHFNTQEGCVNPVVNKTYSKSPMIAIGPNGTKIPTSEYEKIPWSSASIATRKLLTIFFDRETLATHSMTGKPSPAFKDVGKPIKGRLDPKAIVDIIDIVSKKCAVSPKRVRNAITTKCADENKMQKLKALKRGSTEASKRSALRDLNEMKLNQSKN